jgi:hypothetical protein
VSIVNFRYQHTVGQGCFHSGALVESGGRQLSYIYDCGAMARYRGPREREIRSYLKGVGRNSTLGIVFLSHVHADHINGVTQLLKDRKRLRVDTIMLPLINVAERLMAFGRTLAVDAASAQSAFYQSFIVDPVAALSGFGPRQIIVVRSGGADGGAPGSGDDADLPRLDGPPITGPDTEDGKLAWKLVGTGAVHVRHPPSGSGQQGPAQYEVPDTTAVMSGGIAGAWLLAPFVDPMVKASRKAFLDALATECSVPRSQIENWLNNTANVQNLVTTDRDLLVAAYSAVSKDFNLTSLCLYSGPARGTTLGLPRSRRGIFGCVHADNERPGWLGTGDAALKQASRRNAMLRHYGSLVREVGTLLLPHHGSDHNFDPALLRRIRPEVCVASADRYSNWKHPGPHTVQAVCSQPGVLQVVTSQPASRAQERASLG